MEKAKVKLIQFNWRQVGSIQDKDGTGDTWEQFTVGEKGVISIEENETHQWNYVVRLENGTVYRIFNPCFIEYFAVV